MGDRTGVEQTEGSPALLLTGCGVAGEVACLRLPAPL